MTNTEAPSIDLDVREKILRVVRESFYDDLITRTPDEFADAILALPGLQAEAPARELTREEIGWPTDDDTFIAIMEDILTEPSPPHIVLEDARRMLRIIQRFQAPTTSQAEAQAPAAEIEELEKELAGRERRRLDLIEWIEARVGTAWECVHCGVSTYHSHAFECQECGAEMPFEHVMAFKLGAIYSDPKGEPTKDAHLVEAEAQAPTTVEQASVLTDRLSRGERCQLEDIRAWTTNLIAKDFMLSLIDRLAPNPHLTVGAPAPAPTLGFDERLNHIKGAIREYADRYVKHFGGNGDFIAECFSLHAPRMALAVEGQWGTIDAVIAAAKAANEAALAKGDTL